MSQQPMIRDATAADVTNIHQALSHYAQGLLVLPRAPEDIIDHLGNFRIAEFPNGKFLGCVAVRDFGNNLYEVRSLAVVPDATGHGVGSELVKSIIALSKERAPCRLFALTYQIHFFERLGFTQISKETFPEKIWSDCSKCPKQDHCDETALVLDFQ